MLWVQLAMPNSLGTKGFGPLAVRFLLTSKNLWRDLQCSGESLDSRAKTVSRLVQRQSSVLALHIYGFATLSLGGEATRQFLVARGQSERRIAGVTGDVQVGEIAIDLPTLSHQGQGLGLGLAASLPSPTPLEAHTASPDADRRRHIRVSKRESHHGTLISFLRHDTNYSSAPSRSYKGNGGTRCRRHPTSPGHRSSVLRCGSLILPSADHPGIPVRGGKGEHSTGSRGR